jgi:hypothetical protein
VNALEGSLWLITSGVCAILFMNVDFPAPVAQMTAMSNSLLCSGSFRDLIPDRHKGYQTATIRAVSILCCSRQKKLAIGTSVSFYLLLHN